MLGTTKRMPESTKPTPKSTTRKSVKRETYPGTPAYCHVELIEVECDPDDLSVGDEPGTDHVET